MTPNSSRPEQDQGIDARKHDTTMKATTCPVNSNAQAELSGQKGGAEESGSAALVSTAEESKKRKSPRIAPTLKPEVDQSRQEGGVTPAKRDVTGAKRLRIDSMLPQETTPSKSDVLRSASILSRTIDAVEAASQVRCVLFRGPATETN